MKPVALLLALALSVSVSFAQAPSPAAPKEQPVTAIDSPRPVVESVPPNRVAATPAGGDALSRLPGIVLPGDNSAVSLWKLIQSGGVTMIVLGGMSVVLFMLVLVFLFTLRRSAILTPHYMNTADVLLKKKDYLGLLAISSRHSEAVARVVQRTLDFATKNPNAPYEVIREIAESEGSAQAASLQHRPTYLADLGMLSPMVGLLGTVVGIIKSFGVLASGQGGGGSREDLLAAGISEALVATASGLVLGIIAFFFYSYFRNKVQGLISDLEVASAHVVGLIALNYAKKREATRAAVEEEF
ncbi:MAG: MotA/TolQ/ExbB proton channel family protein [Chthoniobacteraceae bacterium]